MSVYADTSLLVSYYVSDANSARAQGLVHATADPPVFTALHRLEMNNALALGIFRQILTPAQVRATWNVVEADLRAGRLLPRAVNWAPVFRLAQQWAVRHTPATGCRSLDILHVAAGRSLGATKFFSFDMRQRALAELVGLTVMP